MLVLTRRVDEMIVIGEEQKIVAKILRVRGGQVRIGIYAPKEIKIYREGASRKNRRRFLNRQVFNKSVFNHQEKNYEYKAEK